MQALFAFISPDITLQVHFNSKGALYSDKVVDDVSFKKNQADICPLAHLIGYVSNFVFNHLFVIHSLHSSYLHYMVCAA